MTLQESKLQLPERRTSEAVAATEAGLALRQLASPGSWLDAAPSETMSLQCFVFLSMQNGSKEEKHQGRGRGRGGGGRCHMAPCTFLIMSKIQLLCSLMLGRDAGNVSNRVTACD